MHSVLRPMEPAHVLGPLTPAHAQSALETHVTLSGAFRRNCAELAAFEAAVGSDAHAGAAGRSPDGPPRGSFAEYVRHVQNAIGAHGVLTEYTNTLASEWFDDARADRYCEAAADLDVLPMSAFLADLPACLVALGPSSVAGAAAADSDGHRASAAAGYRLSRDDLAAWSGWSDDAQRALAGFDEAVCVSAVVDPYLEAQSRLHAHLFGLVEQQLAEADDHHTSTADLWAATD